MPRPKSEAPKLRHHKPSNRAVVTLSGADGRRRDFYLGEWGSPAARVEYARLIATYDPAAPVTPGVCMPTRAGVPADLTVNELLALFIDHARGHYRHPGGEPTTEFNNYKVLLRFVRTRCGSDVAREFGPLRLERLRDAMVSGGGRRRNVNAQVNRVRRTFKWATSEELVPVAVFDALRTLAGLQAGRSAAAEKAPVLPVAPEAVGATVPFLTRHVAGMVRLQALTGMRPGETCRLRRCYIDAAGAVWLYRPARHKLSYRGKPRVVPLGAKAQALLAEFPTADPADFVFSPAAAMSEVQAARSASRKTPRYPSHLKRNAAERAADPKRRPADQYDVQCYGRAVTKAVSRANARRERLAGAGDFDRLPHWHPNQLRHTFATEVRKAHGLEAAQVLLGHSKADVTQVYAERDLTLAVRVAELIG